MIGTIAAAAPMDAPVDGPRHGERRQADECDLREAEPGAKRLNIPNVMLDREQVAADGL